MKYLVRYIVLFALLYPTKLWAEKNPLLLIESYHAEYPWVQSYREGIEYILDNQFEVIRFEMDTKRLPPSHHQERAKQAWNTYLRIQPRLVFLADDNAFRLVGPKFIGTHTPVIYLGINNSPRNYELFGVENITGVLERPTIKNNIHVINAILDKGRPLKVLVLLDSGATASVIMEEIFEGKRQLNVDETRLTLKLVSTWKDWQHTVLNAKTAGYDAMVLGLYHTIIDENGQHVDSEEVIHWSSERAPIPPFGFWEFAVGANKTIGGIVLHGKTQGEAAAQIASRILSGEDISSILPVTPERGRFLFSRSQIEKWGLDEKARIFRRAEFVD